VTLEALYISDETVSRSLTLLYAVRLRAGHLRILEIRCDTRVRRVNVGGLGWARIATQQKIVDM
jgi:hypothetical protein